MSAITVTAACSTCGGTFEPTLHQIKSSTVVNCPGCKICLACGGYLKAGPRPHGLRICKPCLTVAWQSCWRKEAHLVKPPAIVLDGVTLNAYRCELCDRWHRTKIPQDAFIGLEYVARRAGLAELFRSIGFDVDAFRQREPAARIPADERKPE